MKLYNTTDSQYQPKIHLLVYGDGGVGKTTFASTAPRPVMADCEGGTKYFGLRGISMDVARIEMWSDIQEFYATVKGGDYETIVIDPLNELMEKLMAHMREQKNSKLVQRDGNPTMAGWGWLKQTMRQLLKSFRDIDKHLILITHVSEDKDEEHLLKRPAMMTKLAQEVVNMVDIVAYMRMVKDENGAAKRILMVQPESDRYVAKDRTGRLGEIIEPNFEHIVAGVRGNRQFAWLKKLEKSQEEAMDRFNADLERTAEELDAKQAQLVK